MPIFEYSCETCGLVKEHMVKKYDDPIHCPTCSKLMKKLIGAPAFILKGDGFYSPGSNPKTKEGPHIPNEFKEMPDVELNRSLGLPDDHS